MYLLLTLISQKLRGIKAYEIGFCTSQMSALFTSLATKLSLADSIPAIRTDEELLAANYGRAAFHALVECSPGINPAKDGGMFVKMTSQTCY